MQIKLLHAASSGIVIALVLSLILVPSIWEMAGQPQPVQAGPEGKGGVLVAVESSDRIPETVSPQETFKETTRPPISFMTNIPTIIISILVVAAVLFSFVFVRRIEE